MCGIFGFHKLNEKKCNIPTPTIRNIVSYLALENDVRGKDSTGIATVNRRKSVHLLNKTQDVNGFLPNPIVQRYIRETICDDTTTVLGHTRWATTGAVSKVNAQPFRVQNVVGTHNGHINNYKQLRRKTKIKPKTTCDSESLFILAQHYGKKYVQLAEKLEDVNGYFACVWFDRRTPDRIVFARDYQELSVYISLDKSYILWSSDEDVVKKAILCFGLAMEKLNIAIDRVSILHNSGEIEKIDLCAGYGQAQEEYENAYYDWKPYTDSGRAIYPEDDVEMERHKRNSGGRLSNVYKSDNFTSPCDMCGKTKSVYYESHIDNMLCTDCMADYYSKIHNS